MTALGRLQGLLRASYEDDDLRNCMTELRAADVHARAILIMEPALWDKAEHRLENELVALCGELPSMDEDHLCAVLGHREGEYYIGLALGLRVAELLNEKGDQVDDTLS